VLVRLPEVSGFGSERERFALVGGGRSPLHIGKAKAMYAASFLVFITDSLRSSCTPSVCNESLPANMTLDLLVPGNTGRAIFDRKIKLWNRRRHGSGV
jgi:hypothetical protein